MPEVRHDIDTIWDMLTNGHGIMSRKRVKTNAHDKRVN